MQEIEYISEIHGYIVNFEKKLVKVILNRFISEDVSAVLHVHLNDDIVSAKEIGIAYKNIKESKIISNIFEENRERFQQHCTDILAPVCVDTYTLYEENANNSEDLPIMYSKKVLTAFN